MDLSIVIVNYNVKYFLEQCLHSVSKAITELNAEVFVVDNNSVDGSCRHVREKFPWVKLIENRENLGFSKANNQAIRLSEGKYVLLLNPDTVVEEDTFLKCFDFMEATEDAGALGVRMIDGSGKFLPESKRALPTPWVAFYRIFGLSKLFRKSKKFGRYHLGHLPENQINEVEVLAGAFMFMRRKTLDEVGLLDEDYFMYGEDIDLSYRITKGGYKNYYYPETTIIHYKGESTKKGSLNYVMVFYNAMIIFARKHFTNRNARHYSMIINWAIYLRAFIAVSRRFTKRIYRQVIDAALIFTGQLIGLQIWEQLIFGRSDYYPPEYLRFVVPSYILTWLTAIYYSGGYDKPLKMWKLIRGIIVGTLLILVVYALLPESVRFSRALLLIGAVWAMVSTGLWRWIMHLLSISDYQLDLKKRKRIAIVGESKEAERISHILEQSTPAPEVIGLVSPDDDLRDPYIGNIDQVEEICRIHKLDEILFCSANISSAEIIRIMSRLANLPVNYKIAPPESLSIIGSNSINTSGELYTINYNSIGNEANRRAKRLFDLTASAVLLILFPILILSVKKPFRAISKLFLVLVNKRSIVGYSNEISNMESDLPGLKKGLLNPMSGKDASGLQQEVAKKMDVLYAKDYKLSNDLQILWSGWKELGS